MHRLTVLGLHLITTFRRRRTSPIKDCTYMRLLDILLNLHQVYGKFIRLEKEIKDQPQYLLLNI